MTVDTNGWELAILTTSIGGFIVQLYLIYIARQAFVALRGSKNGRRKIAELHAITGAVLLFCHAVFIYFGVRLVTVADPPSYPTEFLINIVLFIGITAGLLIIGLNDLRVRHALSR